MENLRVNIIKVYGTALLAIIGKYYIHYWGVASEDQTIYIRVNIVYFKTENCEVHFGYFYILLFMLSRPTLK